MSLIGECFKAEHYKLERLDYVDSSGVIVGCVLRQPRCVCVDTLTGTPRLCTV